MTQPTPVHQHDCDHCRFLGTFINGEGETLDLYVCPNGRETIIARFGPDGDYFSMARDLVERFGKSGCNPAIWAAFNLVELDFDFAIEVVEMVEV